MMQRWAYSFVLLLLLCGSGQSSYAYHFEGYVRLDSTWEPKVYLSVVESHRNFHGAYPDAVLRVATVDSTGYFSFEGDNLPAQNQFYRLHVIPLEGDVSTYIYNAGNQAHNFTIFIANNESEASFLRPSAPRVFGSVESVDVIASAWQSFDSLKLALNGDYQESVTEASMELYRIELRRQFKAFANRWDDPLPGLCTIDYYLIPRERDEYADFLLDYRHDQRFYRNFLAKLEESYPDSKYLEVLREDFEMAELRLDADRLPGYQTVTWSLMAVIALLVVWIVVMKRQQKKGVIVSPIPSHAIVNLTERERKVAELIIAGKTNKEVAAELFISLSTVKTHINSIYAKLGVDDRDALRALKISDLK